MQLTALMKSGGKVFVEKDKIIETIFPHWTYYFLNWILQSLAICPCVRLPESELQNGRTLGIHLNKQTMHNQNFGDPMYSKFENHGLKLYM